jgi:RND family efflux transporter MFP subunit
MKKLWLNAGLFLLLAGLPARSEQFLQGITEPFKSSTISATVGGNIDRIIFPEGSFVKKGDTIIALEQREQQLEAKRSKLIAESKVELNAASAQLKILKHDYEATQQLFQSTQSVSEEEVWKKEMEYRRAEADLDRLQVQEKREEIEYQIAVEELLKRNIRAPFSGVVVKVHLREGESCRPQEPLVDLVDIHKCRFVGYAETEISTALKKGMKVQLKIGSAGKPVEGVVEFASPVIDPASGLRQVKAVFDNDDGSVQPGVKAKLSYQVVP